MAHYFQGRRQVGDKIQLNLDSGKARLDCSIFEYWLDNYAGLHCLLRRRGSYRSRQNCRHNYEVQRDARKQCKHRKGHPRIWSNRI